MQNRGYGKKLATSIIKYANNNNYKKIIAHINIDNKKFI